MMSSMLAPPLNECLEDYRDQSLLTQFLRQVSEEKSELKHIIKVSLWDLSFLTSDRESSKPIFEVTLNNTLTLSIQSIAEKINFATKNACESLDPEKVFRFSRALN